MQCSEVEKETPSIIMNPDGLFLKKSNDKYICLKQKSEEENLENEYNYEEEINNGIELRKEIE